MGMQGSADVRLHVASVVVTANYHNPSILNNDFLVKNDIVSDGWKVADSISTPAVSVIKYDNSRLYA